MSLENNNVDIRQIKEQMAFKQVMYSHRSMIDECKKAVNGTTIYEVKLCLTAITDYEFYKDYYELVVRNNNNK